MIRPNSYSRDPKVRTFIKIETAAIVIYFDDFYRSFQWPVRLLRYEKGNRWQTDYAPFGKPNYRREIRD